MKNFLGLLAIFLLLSSCSPERKLERMFDKHPQLFEKETVTVTVRDTINFEKVIYLPSIEEEKTFTHEIGKSELLKVETDDFTTFVNFNKTGNDKEKVTVRTVIKEKQIKVTDTLYINKKVPVTITKTKPLFVYKATRWAWWSLGFNIFIIILILATFFDWFRFLPKFGAVALICFLTLQSCSGVSKTSQTAYSKEFARCELVIDSLGLKVATLEKMIYDKEHDFNNLLRNHKLMIEKFETNGVITCQDFGFYFEQYQVKKD